MDQGDPPRDYQNPADPYTKRLIDAVPQDDIEVLRDRRTRRTRRLAEIAARESWRFWIHPCLTRGARVE